MTKYLIRLIALVLLLTSQLSRAEEVTLNFSDADLIAVINSVSQITGKNFIIDPRVKGKVTVVSSKPLNEEEVYNVFLSILQVQGFATVPTKNAIKIIPDATAKQNAAPFTSQRSPGDQLVTRVLAIEHINAAQLVPILRPLVAQQGHLAAYPTTNVLIISDRASNIQRIERIIAEMDKQIDSDIEIIKLRHAFAAEVVRLLSGLNITATDQKAQAGGGVKISADERTNSVLISGERSVRLKYRAIIAELDSPVESAGNTHVVYLRYADAKNVATILGNVGQQVIKAEAKNVGAAGGTSGQGGADAVTVQADEDSNALVISAPASIFPSLRAVIQQIDIPRAQVHVEAIIAEVSLDTTNELGVQWLFTNDDDGPAGAIQFSGSGIDFQGIADGVIPDGATIGLGSFDDNGLSIATIIRALAGDAETNLLSTPSLVTLDNQEAEIIVGQNVPFITGESTTAGADQQNPFRTVERQDIGISLKVKPQINEGDAITMEIEQEVSNIASSSASTVDIITNKRSIKTTVLLEDGAMIVLGGLIDDTVRTAEQKVPVLGDIPLLGALFRSKRNDTVKRNLMVFVRSTIIKDPEKARILSLGKYNFIRDLQLEAAGGRSNSDEVLGPVLLPYE